MLHRSMVSAACVLASTTVASATFVSFASDSDGSSFTLQGSAASGVGFTITHGASPHVNVDLLIDDNIGPQPTVTLQVGFTANLTATWAESNGVGPFFQHTYLVTGGFAFVDRTTGAELLRCNIIGSGSGVMNVSGGESSWGSAGSILASDRLGASPSVMWFVQPELISLAASLGINLGHYDLFPGGSLTEDNAGFTMTFINLFGGGLVQLDPVSRLPTGRWQSESSFSGSIFQFPTPTGASLLGLGALMVARRRRR